MQLARDGYVGYMPSEGLTPRLAAPTHRIAALRTYVYPEPDGKTPPLVPAQPERARQLPASDGRQVPRTCGRRLCLRRAMPCRSARLRPTSSRWPRPFSARPICGAAAPASASTARVWCSSPLKPRVMPRPRDADMQAAELGRATRLRGRRQAPPRRSRVLGGPCRHHDERQGLPARQCLPHGGRGRALRRGEAAHQGSRLRGDVRAAAATRRAALAARSRLKDAEQIKQDDDRDRNADQPQENAAHGPLPPFHGGGCPASNVRNRLEFQRRLGGDGAAARGLELEGGGQQRLGVVGLGLGEHGLATDPAPPPCRGAAR